MAMTEKQLETLRRNNQESHEFVKSCFRFALMAILKDENDTRVSVTRLCQVAGVSRMAFYRNYDTVEDVLVDEISSFVMSFAKRIGGDIYENWLALFETVDDHRSDLEAIVKAGFETKMLDVFLLFLPTVEESRTLQTIWMSLFYSMTVKWLKEKKPRKSADMARLAYKYTKNIPLVASD